MKSEDIVLGILSEKSCSGYEIKHKFSTIFSNFYNASFGSVYPILHNLENQGKVTKETINQEGKPNKKVYSITEKGQKSFVNYLQSTVEQEKIKWDFMVRLFYAGRINKISQRKLLEEEVYKLENEIIKLLDLKKEEWENMDSFQSLSFEIGIIQKQATIDKIKEFLKTL